MAFHMSGGEFSINGVPIGNVENIEIEIQNPKAWETVTSLPKTVSFEAEFDAIAESVWLELMCHFGFASKPKIPDWVSNVIRIPERRIQQILGG